MITQLKSVRNFYIFQKLVLTCNILCYNSDNTIAQYRLYKSIMLNILLINKLAKILQCIETTFNYQIRHYKMIFPLLDNFYVNYFFLFI